MIDLNNIYVLKWCQIIIHCRNSLKDCLHKYGINEAIIENLDLNPSMVAIDVTGFSSSHADKYYATIIKAEYSFYTKCHITIDVDTRIILYA